LRLSWGVRVGRDRMGLPVLLHEGGTVKRGARAGFTEAVPRRMIDTMRKPKEEAELFKSALQAGIRYAEGRGAVQFEATDSASDKALYIYRLLVHDKLITPMPEDQVGEKTIRHRLASWYAHVPKDPPT
jgi:Domain of unknown function (DUF5062)